MNGSGPIMPTMRVGAIDRCVGQRRLMRQAVDPSAATRRFSSALSCSAWISAILKCSPSSRAISRAMRHDELQMRLAARRRRRCR